MLLAELDQSKQMYRISNRTKTTIILASLCALSASNWTLPADARTFSTYEQALEDLDESRVEPARDKLRKIVAQNPGDADAHLELSRACMDLDDCAGTIAESKRALEIDPKLFRAYAYRAYCLFKSGRMKEGFADSEKAISLYTVNPYDWSIWVVYKNRAKAFKMIQRPREAQADLEKANVFVLLDEAGKERESGRLEAAIEKIDNALTLDAHDADLWFMRGVLGSNQGKYWQAIADFTRALKFAPDAVTINYFRGDSYQQLAMHKQAIDDFTTVLKAKPKIVAYRFVCETGRLRNELMRDDTSAVSLDDVYFLRAQSYAALGKLALALKDLDAAGKLDPSDDKAFAKKAELILGTGKFDQAIKEYTKAVAANPTDWTRYKERGDAYLQLGKNTDAINDYSEVIKLTPKEPGAYMFRALALKSIGQYSEAIPDFSQVLALRPDDDDAYMERADCYRLMHQYKEALKDLDKVADILPSNNNFVMEARAKVFAEQGDDDRARIEMLKLEKTRQVEIHKNDSRNQYLVASMILAMAVFMGVGLFAFLKKKASHKK